MPIRTVSTSVQASLRSALLVTVSAAALLAAGADAEARSLGGRSPSPTAAAVAAGQAAQLEASRAARAAQNALKRATLSIQAMQASQQAARDAALAAINANPDLVKNGLQAGGLVVGRNPDGTPIFWQGADLPTQSQTGDRTNVTVKQTQQKAILEWETFNVGGKTDLYFDQRAGGADVANWVALNRVLDPSGAPSKILGSIKAEGQVYVVNRNGIIFGGASQVNVGTLVASSLSLTNEQFLAGLTTRFSVLGGGGNDYGIPTFGDHATQAPYEGVGLNDPSQAPAAVIGAPPGDVVTEKGAIILTHTGGKAMLFAPHVTNAGTIATPEGQAILAAGEQVWLAPSTSGVRGLDVAVSAPSPYMMSHYQVWGALGYGTLYNYPFITALRDVILPAMEARAASVDYRATNNGVIAAAHGNILVEGRSVDQNGVAYASTALNNLDGSIALRALGQGMMAYSANFDVGNAMVWWAPGTLTLGAGSITTVVPDALDTGTIESSSLGTRYRPGSIELRGRLIDIKADAGVVVPAGTITAIASTYAPTTASPSDSRDPTGDGSRIYVDEGAYLSVAGLTDVTVAMESNVVAAELRINELRDSILYKNSWLSGTTVYVDKREGGTFTDGPMAGVDWVDGQPGKWVGTPLADVSDWLGSGTTTLAELSTVGGKIVLKAGGDVITRAGSLLDVGGGSVTYQGGWVRTTKLLGANGKVYDIGDALPDQVYIALADGYTRYSERWGVTETWTNPLSKSRGRYEQGYTEGRNAGSITLYNGGGLVLEGSMYGGVIAGERQFASGKLATAGSLTFGGGGTSERTWIPSNVIIADEPVGLADNFSATSALPTTLYDPSSSQASLSKTTYLSDDMLNASELGAITIYYNNTFKVVADAHVELSPGAALTVTYNNGTVSPALTTAVEGTIRIAGGSVTIATDNTLRLGAESVIDVSGAWVNDLSGVRSAAAVKIGGGSISLRGGWADIEEGAVLDASGGAWVSAPKGSPSLKAGDAGSVSLQGLTTADIARLDMRAYAAGSGGSLTLTTSGAVQIGGAAPIDPAVLYISEALFGDKGFRSIAIGTSGDVIVPDGVSVAQVPVSRDLSDVDYANVASGTPVSEIGTIRVLPDIERAKLAPTSFKISTTKSIVVGEGATLATDIGGSVVLTSSATGEAGHESIRVAGTINTPAGSIALEAGSVALASTARLMARGAARIYTDPYRGERSGDVANGGSVSITGSMNLAAGAVIDVSGASGVIDVMRSRKPVAVQLVSDGGRITLSAGTAMSSVVDATLLGEAGGEGATGGTLSVSDSLTASTAKQNTFTSVSYLGYFSYVGTGGKYNYDPVTKAYSAAPASDGAYNFIGNNYTALDIDPNTAGTQLIGNARSYIVSLPKFAAGLTQIVDGSAADAAAGGSLAPSTHNASITDQIAAIADANLFVATRSGNTAANYVYTPTAKMNVKNIEVMALTVSSSSINNGGFSAVNINAPTGLKLGDGVKLNLPKSLVSIATRQILAPSAGATAEVNAAYLALSRSGSTTTAIANTSPTSGTLELNAQLIDVSYGLTRGYAETRLTADEIRLVAPVIGSPAQINVDGTLTMTAAQVSPTTQTIATINAVNRIDVLPNGTAELPWSAGGSLTLTAPTINVDGALRAPFGQITLSATNAITLGSNAVVSVSGNGQLLPYGFVYDTDNWAVATGAGSTAYTLMAGPPEKKITLSAPQVVSAAGSVIDISGGGDLYASEFVVGSGGSHNVLAMPGVYAIVPSSSAIAPTGSGAASGTRLWLDGGKGVPAGWYTLLPASYALLPGAYAVQMVSGSGDRYAQPAVSMSMADGTQVMSGKLGNALTGASDPQSSVWRVMSGSVVRGYSEYNEASANAFFSSDAFKLTQYRLTGVAPITPRLPSDGGSLVLKATQTLVLDGQVESGGRDGGRGGWVDIAAAKIAVVGAGQSTNGLANYLILDSDRLSNLGAESLLLGGVRSGTAQGTGVAVTAESVVVRNDDQSALVGPELILAASDSVVVEAGSVLAAEGSIAGGGGDLIMTQASAGGDYGALIRLSNGDAVTVVRTNVNSASTHGHVDIQAGSVLAGGNALLIEATRDTTLAASAVVSARDITLGASRIGLGGGSGGLTFDAVTLARFAAAENVTLRSYSTIDFYTGVDFGSAGLKSITLDSAGFVGRTPNDVVISGDTIRLRNTVGAFSDPSVTDQAGALTFAAGELVLGTGSKSVRGFGAVRLSGATRIVGEGSGKFDAGNAAVVLATPLITGRDGSSQSIATSGMLNVVSTGAAAQARDAGSLGSFWAFNGGGVDFGGRVDALGGTVALTASSGAVTVANGAIIDVGGLAKTFYDVVEYADAGSIELTAIGGGVNVAAGSRLNLSAVSGGGDAGKLSAVAATGGAVVLDGAIDARAAKGRGGSFALDIATLSNFADFSGRLDAAGFTTSREFRIRTGNVVLDGVTAVEDFSLTADAGSVTVKGTINADKAYGGSISIVGGGGLVMEDTARLRASSTTALGGGRVLLDAGAGRLDVKGGAIDVAGGEGGRVRFRALQTGGSDYVAVDHLAATVNGNAVLEGVKVYTASTTSAVQDAAVADADAFAANAGAVATRLGGIPGVKVMSGIEIRSTGDLTVDRDWNLATLAAHEGGLTLRAAGDLKVLGNLSDGFDQAGRTGTLLTQSSWDMRLVAGADLQAANMLALRQGASGALTVGDAANAYLVRTGTGDLSVRTGGDLTLANVASAIYTAGRKDTTTYPDFVQSPRQLWINGTYTVVADPVYGIEGGNLSIGAGGDVTAVIPDGASQTLAAWLQRQGKVDKDGVFVAGLTDAMWPYYHAAALEQSAWWVEYGAFQHGVGALGGGNVALSAGGDVTDLTVALPTNAQVRGGRTLDEAKTLVLRNGGSMSVDVAGSIRGGQYYVGRGTADIRAAETTTGRTAISLSYSSGGSSVMRQLAPVLALGDTAMSVKTAGDMTIQTVADPLMMPMRIDTLPSTTYEYGSYMSGFTDRAALSLVAVGGDVAIGGATPLWGRRFDDTNSSSYTDVYWGGAFGDAVNLFPTVTRIASLNGSVTSSVAMRVLPSTALDFSMLAEGTVTPGTIIMGRNLPAVFPTPLRPAGATGSFTMPEGMTTLIQGRSRYDSVIDNPTTLLQANDFEPSRIYSNSGSIIGGSMANNILVGGTIIANEQLWIRAGEDIRYLTAQLRNVHETDVSWLDAGNDISTVNVTVEGPGSVLLTASRDVYAPRVYSVGNRKYDANNRPIFGSDILGLPSEGAAIDVIAGLNGQLPAYEAFLAAYLDPANVAAMPAYLTTIADGRLVPIYLTDAYDEQRDGKQMRFGLVSFVASVTGLALSPDDAWAVFRSLPAMTQQRFVRQVYLQELRAAGRDQLTLDAHNQPINGGYNRGYDAVAKLFPGDDWKGSVVAQSLYLRTMAGGDISVMAPGGGVQVASLQKVVPSGDGIVTLGYGNINIFARDNVTVNRSRVLTFAGGDETLWSTLGDIDAGRGAKTTRVPSAPDVVTDADTVTRILEKADMSGSGIGTIEGYAEVEPGDVDLIAPHGTVNAGDAGIRVSGDLNLAALHVVNVANIKVEGKSKGVPVVEAPDIGGLSEASNASGAAAQQAATPSQRATEQPSVIIVEVLGYGGSEDVRPRPTGVDEEEKARKRNQSQMQDPRSRYQVLGAGALSDEQMEQLAEDNRKMVGR